MQGTETHHYHHHSDTVVTGNDTSTNFSGLNKRGGERSARSNNHDSTGNANSNGGSSNDDSYVEITLDVHDDSVAVHSVKTAVEADIEDPELALSKIGQVSQELKRLTSLSKRPQAGKFDSTNSAVAHASKGLKFIRKTHGGTGWAAVEKRFDELTASTDGLLPRSLFCECIGMNESKEFAGELFDALGRRWHMTGDSINKAHMNESKESAGELFDARWHTTGDSINKAHMNESKEFAGELFDALGGRWNITGDSIHKAHMNESKEFAGELFDALGRRWNITGDSIDKAHMNESKEFAGELFDALGRRWNITGDSINKAQLHEFWVQISDQSFNSRLQTFFDMVDKDADGRITEEEFREIICLSASANKLSNVQKQADEYAALIMEELDPYNCGYILIEDFEMLLLQVLSHSVTDENRDLNQMLSQRLVPTARHFIRRWYEDFKYFLLDNWQRIWVMALWIGIMAGLFAYKYVQYRNRAVDDVMGPCVCMAKGAAETLKLNMALILLPVSRKTITWLRNKTRLGAAVPFDDNLNFHKVIAVAIATGVGIHGLAHLTCDFPRLLHASPEKYKPMIPYFGKQPTSYWFFVKGAEVVTGIIMVILMAIAFTLATPLFRRNRLNLPKPFKKLAGFNAFWYSHHLFIIVYALLIVHGIKLYLTHEWYKKTTWMYLAVPITLYAGERLIRAFRSSIKAVKILKVGVYPGNVLELHMSKPRGFKYKSGQYMFINCAAASPFEWHAFSISSAPRDDYLSVHIRTLGDWTRQLKTVFSEVCQPEPTGKSGLLRADCLQGENNPDFPRVLIDGPYGAPPQDYKKYEVVLLIGLGIGATPMISIVKDIVNNMKAIEAEENALEDGNRTPGDNSPVPPNCSPLTQKRKSGSGSGGNFKTKKAYFYWVAREQESFDRFKGILSEVAEMDKKGVIEMHNYCTSVYEEGDARSTLIEMLQSLNYAKNGVDIVSGTRVKSHFARPNMRNVYKRIALNHPRGRVGVFYCGEPALTRELRQLASDFSRKTTTKFDFH